MRWAVPGTRGAPDSFSPLYLAQHLLQSIATRFDLDGDGALNLAEYNAFQRACCGVGAFRDVSLDSLPGYVDADKHDFSKWSQLTKAAKYVHAVLHTRTLAHNTRHHHHRRAGVELEANAPLPLHQVAAVWVSEAAGRSSPSYPGPRGNGGRLRWEVANTMVIRLGAGMKRQQMMSLLEGSKTVGRGGLATWLSSPADTACTPPHPAFTDDTS